MKSPFGLVSQHLFVANQPQDYSRGAFGANMNNFEGERAPKQRNFLTKISHAVTKNTLKILPGMQKVFDKIRPV